MVRRLTFQPGGKWRIVALLGMLGIMVFAIYRFDPKGRWFSKAEVKAVATPASVLPPLRRPVTLRELRLRGEAREFVGKVGVVLAAAAPATPATILPDAVRMSSIFDYLHFRADLASPRLAPEPDPKKLEAALDNEPLWIENPNDEDGLRRLRHRGDAAARNHLLNLVHTTRQELISADADAGVRYSEMVLRPALLRGEVVRVRGRLRWVEKLDLHGAIDGLPHAYIGSLHLDEIDLPVAILFTELPPHMPPESEWSQLNVPDATFDGMFLKVFSAQANPRAARPQATIDMPLLVGKTFDLPPLPADDRSHYLPMGLLALFVSLSILVGGVGYLWYRWHERRYRVRMASLQAEARQQAAAASRASSPTGPAEKGPIDFPLFDTLPPESER